MAFSHVYIGASYPSDVLVGLLLGAMVSLISFRLVRRPLMRLLGAAGPTVFRVLVTAGPRTPRGNGHSQLLTRRSVQSRLRPERAGGGGGGTCRRWGHWLGGARSWRRPPLHRRCRLVVLGLGRTASGPGVVGVTCPASCRSDRFAGRGLPPVERLLLRLVLCVGLTVWPGFLVPGGAADFGWFASWTRRRPHRHDRQPRLGPDHRVRQRGPETGDWTFSRTNRGGRHGCIGE
jgi:hypothetical protein